MYLKPNYHIPEGQMLSEQEHIIAAKDDPGRFAPLYNTYYEPIFRFVYQRLDSRDIAFDITAQVFLKALSNIKKYEFKGVPFSSWLYRIAINELNQIFRNNKARRTVNADSDALFYIIEEINEDKLDAYHDGLADCLAELDKDSLQMIEMRFFEKMAFKEIGEILGMTENNAKVKTYRILEKLKTLITSKK